MLEHFPLKSDNMTLKVPLYRVLDLNAPLFCFVLFCFVSFCFFVLFVFIFYFFVFFGGGQIGMTTVIGGWGGGLPAITVKCQNKQLYGTLYAV